MRRQTVGNRAALQRAGAIQHWDRMPATLPYYRLRSRPAGEMKEEGVEVRTSNEPLWLRSGQRLPEHAAGATARSGGGTVR